MLDLCSSHESFIISVRVIATGLNNSDPQAAVSSQRDQGYFT